MPASRWSRCLAQVLAHEGGYIDHPSDPGGATNMGITHKTLARWRGVSPWWNLDKSEVRNLTRAEAGKIYHALYWERVKGPKLPPGVDLAVFDYAVNSGPDRSIKLLQALVGVERDGLVGPITLGAVAERDPVALIAAICAQRLSFLQSLSTWAVFGRGWASRVEAVREAALADAELTPPSQTTKEVEPMNILDGKKTYAIGLLMLIVGVAQIFGLEIAAFGDYSGPQLVMEALAVIFLRRGIKGDVSRA